jgi:S-DNA-T family DNA segregation ATPase FtsK/SpoIIIE
MAKLVIIKNTILRDAIGLLCLGLGLLLAVSLVSYRYSDPLLATGGAVHNWGGVVGSFLAGLVLSSLGVAAFLVPVLFVILAINFFKREGIAYLTLDLLCALLITLSILTILALVFASGPVLYDRTIHAGGLIGLTLASLLKGLFNTAGALIFSAVSLFLFTVILLGVTTREIISLMGSILSGAWRAVNAIVRLFVPKGVGEKKAKRKAAAAPGVEDDDEAPITETDDEEPHPGHERPAVIEPRMKKGGAPEEPVTRKADFEYPRASSGYRLPSIDLLTPPDQEGVSVDRDALVATAKNLEKKLSDFGVRGKVTEVRPGPIITLFEFEPAAGERINKIAALGDDIAMAMSAYSVRIVAPIPGKSVVGFEIPNPARQTVRLSEIIASDRFDQSKSKLTCALGKDIYGNPVVTDLAKMPHLLVAGATGAGKSVCINTMILSILFKARPEEVRLLLIDPKMLELSFYQGIGHLILPVVTDPRQAALALRWVVEEMERRYRVMAELGVKNVAGYNQKIESSEKPPAPDSDGAGHRMPLMVVVIDELADLMMTSSKEVEESITRLAHMARAAGIHLILATQRPSVNVLTGVIKANFPARISFQVSSRVDSRTILDTSGAEHLLGKGDMLFLPPATSKLIRVHGAYVSEDDIMRVVEFARGQGAPRYEEVDLEEREDGASGYDGEYDEKYDEAVALVAEAGKASISLIQRHLRIGYNRAARIIERMEEDGIIGPSEGIKPREVFINRT